MNRIDFRGALVIEDALEQSRRLTTLWPGVNWAIQTVLNFVQRGKSPWHCNASAESAFTISRVFQCQMKALLKGSFALQSPHFRFRNVAHNPLGVMGLRSLLRLLAREKSGLVSIDMENTFSGELMPCMEGIQVFTYTDPGGSYSLHLDRPYHRSLLRILQLRKQTYCGTVPLWFLFGRILPLEKGQNRCHSFRGTKLDRICS